MDVLDALAGRWVLHEAPAMRQANVGRLPDTEDDKAPCVEAVQLGCHLELVLGVELEARIEEPPIGVHSNEGSPPPVP